MSETITLARASVRPRDAASLVLVDTRGDEPRVLMGKRHKKMKFVPDAFVFPGGKLDPDDLKARPATPLAPAAGFGAKTQALAMAAIRETFEETGLILAGPGDVGANSGPSWSHFHGLGLAPRLDTLSCLARAITPASSPIRFHARFFAAAADDLQGTLAGSGELEELDWYPLSQALKLPVIDVTEFVLREVLAGHAASATRARIPLFSYRNDRPVIRA
ncbi:MAG TPA: NUDIX domain-containing protein [Parvibaculum sp.]|jgi:8-oxo-dGTP pyrophosphatase MutT (NUDIX family)